MVFEGTIMSQENPENLAIGVRHWKRTGFDLRSAMLHGPMHQARLSLPGLWTESLAFDSVLGLYGSKLAI